MSVRERILGRPVQIAEHKPAVIADDIDQLHLTRRRRVDVEVNGLLDTSVAASPMDRSILIRRRQIPGHKDSCSRVEQRHIAVEWIDLQI
ncbi:hypothetical protein D3C72_1435300 [compost metagenome]